MWITLWSLLPEVPVFADLLPNYSSTYVHIVHITVPPVDL